MRKTCLISATLLLALAASGTAQAAGLVKVQWTAPERYADAGRGAFDRERNLAELGRHLESLGRLLPDGQTLNIEVLDLELAGELRPFGRFHDEVRVLNGRVDWPRMQLRYTLSDGTRTLQGGEAQLSDPAYFFRSLRSQQQTALGYEKRMLDEWVATLLAPPR
jgi:hypothetical protein